MIKFGDEHKEEERRVKYYMQGGGPVQLSDQDFVAEGGEGKVYASGNHVYKIYRDPAAALPAGKLQELAALDRDEILRPLHALLDGQNQTVGYVMRRVDDCVALPRLFTNDFRARAGIEARQVLALLRGMVETTGFIHAQNCLLVDGNEMNYLVRAGDFQRAFFLDVDSYQTPSYPATAIMPSIRDYFATRFTIFSDWFAFAIVACQLILGIHPYKGKHPDFKKQDLEARMRAQVSIFHPGVKLPAAARDFREIPPGWQDWMIALFERGERAPPPTLPGGMATVVYPAATAPTGQGRLDLQPLHTAPERIQAVWFHLGAPVVATATRLYLARGDFPLPPRCHHVVFSPRQQTPLAAVIDPDGLLRLHDVIRSQESSTTIPADELIQHGNALFALHGARLTQVKMVETHDQLLITPGTAWPVLANSVQALDGCAVQSALGLPVLIVPYRDRACAVTPVPELRGYRVIEGAHRNGVVLLTAFRHGQYDRFTLRFSAAFDAYQCGVEPDVIPGTTAFAVLDNGVAVRLRDQGVEVFHREQALRKSVDDNRVHEAMRLVSDGAGIFAVAGERLYRMRLGA